MIKLLYITNGIDGSGGLERVLSIKASYLAEHYDYEVTILCLNGHHKRPFYKFSSKVKTFSFKVSGSTISYMFQYIKGIKRSIQNINPDIISVCDDGLKGLMLPLILKSHIPIIYERHATVNLNFVKGRNHFTANLKNKIQHSVMKWAATKFDKFVVLTNSNIQEWENDNVLVIPNPLSFYPVELIQSDVKNIIAVGSHSYNKGYDLLLESWKRIHISFPDWKLLIYGKKDAKKTYINLNEKLGLTNSVHFYDPVENIEKVYQDASILVLPSRSEGFGMVLIEAMASGLPCVSFDCPHGPGDIIEDGKDGFLVENGNTDAFTEKIIDLIRDPELRIKMGKRGRDKVLKYSIENILKQWDDLFTELLV